MIRLSGVIIFAGAFLAISSSLRGSVANVINSIIAYAGIYSPYSYVVMALIAFAVITVTLRTGQTTDR